MYNYNYLDNYNNLRSNINNTSYVPSYDNYNMDRSADDRVTVGGMELFAPKEAYEKGNLFKDLYTPYKNYKPYKLTPKDERQKLFLELSEYDFAAHELNLYLDLHPEDKKALNLFNDYRRRANELLEKYESQYGPLTVSSDALVKSPFLWEEQTFPFDKGGVSNV